jgi:ferric-dicitrate binding protein FerR (iron transport regulator)
MIDRHYGQPRDGREHAIRLLDAFSACEQADVHRWESDSAAHRANVHRVEARWTSLTTDAVISENGTGP